MKHFPLILIILLASCNQNVKQSITKAELVGKSFDFINLLDNDTLNIEFQDSVYNTFTYGFHEYPEIDWRNWELHNNILIMEIWGGQFTAELEKINEKEFHGFNFNLSDSLPEFSILERNRPWNKDLIFGKWSLDISSAPEMMMLTRPKFWSGELPDYRYEINECSIINELEQLNSRIIINSSNEYIKFINTNNNAHKFWKIKSLTDSTMMVDMIIEFGAVNKRKELKNVKMTRKH